MDYRPSSIDRLGQVPSYDGTTRTTIKADLAILSRGNEGAKPVVYRLNPDAVSGIHWETYQGDFRFPEGTFSVAGILMAHNKQNKEMTLFDPQEPAKPYSLQYQHLVTANHSIISQHPHSLSDSLSDALRAYVEALQVKLRLSTSYPSSSNESHQLLKQVLKKSKDSNYAKLVEQNSPTTQPDNPTRLQVGQKFYEVLL